MKKKILIIAMWLLIWQLLSLIIHNKILLVGPAETIQSLITLSQNPEFWQSVIASAMRIGLGFILGALFGILMAALAYQKPLVKDFLEPFVAALKAIPVASFVIIVLIWIGNVNLSIVISFLIVFPIMYLNTLEGLNSTDKKLLEMAHVYRIGKLRKIRYIYLPEIYFFLVSGVKLSIGMAWKSGVAAEVIGQPLGTIGNGLYRAKIYLETGYLFAWTLVIIILSWLFEKVFLLLIKAPVLFGIIKTAPCDIGSEGGAHN